MICRLLTLAASVLLLTSAVRSVNRDDRISVRDEWCSRVCPKRTISEPAAVPGTPPPECPHLICPTPECATPVCPPPPPPPVCAKCPEGSPSAPRTLPWKTLKNYTFTPQGYYKYYSEMYVDWFDAQIFCESEGANLLILNSEEEDNYIRNQMKPGWIHIGIHHLFPDRGFTTVLGNPVNSTGFNTWLSGHSVRNVTNNCGFINKSRRGLGMGLCSDRGRFICEISFG
ncbi:hypothetical protein R5R35_002859 [Gryllus longicercus]|uniref:C-type lectin domain-containing protein n=1 Tax=Gryllus longicercus TaxID=2509291 RepID=A0AAN9VHN3_9ORTH